MDSVTTPNTCPSVTTDWVRPETCVALDAFFQGFGFEATEDLATLAAWVLEGVTASNVKPQAAVALARARMETWLTRVLDMDVVGEGRLLTRGRAAFVLCDGARFGASVLTRDAVPRELVRALRAAVPVPTPAQVATPMPEQQLVLWPLGERLRRWLRASQPDMSVSR
ncbi:hypothetical protein [Myxococcus sp. Y35]|uniref:hypothetical protein n=1 Tax=Pseudomyxococcus flavus TaxID=3115648 RepID=UPI003CE7376F